MTTMTDTLPADVFDGALTGFDLSSLRREALLKVERMIAEAPQVEVPPRHYFTNGLYAREITLPKGCAMSGGIHKFGHVSIVLAGDVSMITEHGRERIRAPRIIVSQPGIKRVGFAHEDTTWVTVHANPQDCQNVEQLWAALIAETYGDMDRFLHDQGGF